MAAYRNKFCLQERAHTCLTAKHSHTSARRGTAWCSHQPAHASSQPVLSCIHAVCPCSCVSCSNHVCSCLPTLFLQAVEIENREESRRLETVGMSRTKAHAHPVLPVHNIETENRTGEVGEKGREGTLRIEHEGATRWQIVVGSRELGSQGIVEVTPGRSTGLESSRR